VCCRRSYQRSSRSRSSLLKAGKRLAHGVQLLLQRKSHKLLQLQPQLLLTPLHPQMTVMMQTTLHQKVSRRCTSLSSEESRRSHDSSSSSKSRAKLAGKCEAAELR
jgi:hypothetical protein